MQNVCKTNPQIPKSFYSFLLATYQPPPTLGWYSQIPQPTFPLPSLPRVPSGTHQNFQREIMLNGVCSSSRNNRACSSPPLDVAAIWSTSLNKLRPRPAATSVEGLLYYVLFTWFSDKWVKFKKYSKVRSWFESRFYYTRAKIILPWYKFNFARLIFKAYLKVRLRIRLVRFFNSYFFYISL